MIDFRLVVSIIIPEEGFQSLIFTPYISPLCPFLTPLLQPKEEARKRCWDEMQGLTNRGNMNWANGMSLICQALVSLWRVLFDGRGMPDWQGFVDGQAVVWWASHTWLAGCCRPASAPPQMVVGTKPERIRHPLSSEMHPRGCSLFHPGGRLGEKEGKW